MPRSVTWRSCSTRQELRGEGDVRVQSQENVTTLHQLARGVAIALAPQHVAQHLHSLLCKLSLQCREPQTLKGSLVCDLFKWQGLQDGDEVLPQHCVINTHFFVLVSSLGWHPSFVTRSVVECHVDMATFLARTKVLKRSALIIFATSERHSVP